MSGRRLRLAICFIGFVSGDSVHDGGTGVDVVVNIVICYSGIIFMVRVLLILAFILLVLILLVVITEEGEGRTGA